MVEDKCVLCGKDIDPKNYASFMVKGREVRVCVPCYEKNSEAIGYMMTTEIFVKHADAILCGESGSELHPIEEKE